jgi:hypothetical protein
VLSTTPTKTRLQDRSRTRQTLSRVLPLSCTRNEKQDTSLGFGMCSFGAGFMLVQGFRLKSGCWRERECHDDGLGGSAVPIALEAVTSNPCPALGSIWRNTKPSTDAQSTCHLNRQRPTRGSPLSSLIMRTAVSK